MFLDLIVVLFFPHRLSSGLCGNLHGMVTHFRGAPQSPSLGSPLGQHPGVLQCDPMGSQLSPCGPTGQWLPPGQGVWHPPNVMTSPGMNSGCHHPGVSGPPVAHGPPTMPFQSGAVNIHQGQDPIPSPTPSTPLPSSGLDISQLEERLGEAINKKFESMTETLRASMSTCMENSSMTAANASAKAPGPVISPGPEPPMPNAPDGTTVTCPNLNFSRS